MPKPPPPEKDDDLGSEASYYSYSEYTVPASEVSVNRRWYNRLDTWRQDIVPSTPKPARPDRLSPFPQSSHHARQSGAEDAASTVSPKESISSRPSPRLGPVANPLPAIPSFEQAVTLLREEPRIMQDGRVDTVRVYDMGDGIEARVHPEPVKADLTPRNTPVDDNDSSRPWLESKHRHGDLHDRFGDLAINTKLPPSQGTFYTSRASQSGKLGPITEPYQMDAMAPAEASRKIMGYQIGEDGRRYTLIERELPPLPLPSSTFYDDTNRSQAQQRVRSPLAPEPFMDSARSVSKPRAPAPKSVRHRPVAAVDSAIVRLDTVLERDPGLMIEDKENGNSRYRKGTPYPSVRHLNLDSASSHNGSRDSESTVQQVIDQNIRVQDRPTRAARVETFDPDKEEQTTLALPRKRYPDPTPGRTVLRSTAAPSLVSRNVFEGPPRTDSKSTVSRPVSRATTRPEQKVQSTAITYKDEEPDLSGGIPDEPLQHKGDTPIADGPRDGKSATRPTTPAIQALPIRSSPSDLPEAIDVITRSPVSNRHRAKLPAQSERTPSDRSFPSANRREEQLTHERVDPDSHPAIGMSLENRARESSHGSAWTDTVLSTPDSRRRQAAGREQDSDGYRSGSDTGPLRRSRRRSPSSQHRRVSVQGSVGYGGITNMQAQFSVPPAGAVIHPPMIGPMIPNYRPMIPRPPMMAMVPRARPAAIMPAPQVPYGWMGGMSPPTPMGGGWLPQRSMPNMPSHMNQMQSRASYSAPPTSMNTPGRGLAGVIGINSGLAMNQAAAGQRTRREKANRTGQRRSSGNVGVGLEPLAIPQSSRRRRNEAGQPPAVPRRARDAPRALQPVSGGRRRAAAVARQAPRRSGEPTPRAAGRASGTRSRPVPGGDGTQENPSTKSWVRNVFAMGRRPD